LDKKIKMKVLPIIEKIERNRTKLETEHYNTYKVQFSNGKVFSKTFKDSEKAQVLTEITDFASNPFEHLALVSYTVGNIYALGLFDQKAEKCYEEVYVNSKNPTELQRLEATKKLYTLAFNKLKK